MFLKKEAHRHKHENDSRAGKQDTCSYVHTFYNPARNKTKCLERDELITDAVHSSETSIIYANIPNERQCSWVHFTLKY